MSLNIGRDEIAECWLSRKLKGLKIVVSMEYAEDNGIANWKNGTVTRRLEHLFADALSQAMREDEIRKKIETNGEAEWLVTNDGVQKN